MGPGPKNQHATAGLAAEAAVHDLDSDQGHDLPRHPVRLVVQPVLELRSVFERAHRVTARGPAWRSGEALGSRRDIHYGAPIDQYDLSQNGSSELKHRSTDRKGSRTNP